MCARSSPRSRRAPRCDFLLHRPTEIVKEEKLPVSCVLPPRVQHDLQQNLARQGHEGALASLQSITSRSALQYLNALRRENAFLCLNYDDRYVADSLHLALYEGLPEYKEKVCLPEQLFPTVQAEHAVKENEVIGYWSRAEQHEASPLASAGQPACQEMSHWFVMLGPTAAEPDPMICHVGRGHLLERCKVRAAYDAFCEDVQFGQPASGFRANYLRARLGALLETLELSSAGPAVEAVLTHLVGHELEGDDAVGADQAVELLQCIAHLLRLSAATRIHHPALNAFLRSALRPYRLLNQFE